MQVDEEIYVLWKWIFSIPIPIVYVYTTSRPWYLFEKKEANEPFINQYLICVWVCVSHSSFSTLLHIEYK